MNKFAWAVKVNSVLRRLSDCFNSNVVVVVSFACIMFLSGPVLGQNKINSAGSSHIRVPNNLQMEIGKKLTMKI